MIEKLRERMQALKTEMGELIAAAEKNEGGTLTEEQTAQYDTLEAEFNAVKATYDRAVRNSDAESALGESPGRKTSAAKPGEGPRISQMHDRREDDGKCGYNTLAEFAKDVYAVATHKMRPSPKYAAYQEYPQIQDAALTTGHTHGSQTDSGVAVPPAMSREVYSLMFTEGSLLAAVDAEPTESNVITKERDEATPWGTTGVQAYWGDPTSVTAQTQQKASADKPDLVPIHELNALVGAKNDLLDDAPRLQNKLTRQSAMRLQWKAEDAILYGTGAGQPYGFFNHGSFVSVAKEGSQTADTIVAANVVKMWARLLRTPNATPLWLINPDAIPQLPLMSVGNQPVWIPSNEGFKGAYGGTLLGIPVVITDHAKTVGDLGDIMLVDAKGYYFPRRTSGIEFASSMHLWFDQKATAFLWTMRFGGQPHLSAAVSPANGSNTRSHFVGLAARA